MLVPTAKLLPLIGEQATIAVPQLSVAVGSKVTVARQESGAVETILLDGQEMAGGMVSRTVTVKEQVLVFPAASVAVQVTVLVPTAKLLPLIGEQTTTGVSQLSAAVAENVTVARQSIEEVETT